MMPFAMLTPWGAITALAIIVVLAVVLARLLTRGLAALFSRQADQKRSPRQPARHDEQPHGPQ